MNHVILEGTIIDNANSKTFENDKFIVISCQLMFSQYVGEGKGYNNTGYENCFMNINYRVWKNGGTRFNDKTKVVIEGELRQTVGTDGKRHTRVNVSRIKPIQVLPTLAMNTFQPAPKPVQQQNTYYQPYQQPKREVEYPKMTEGDAILFDD